MPPSECVTVAVIFPNSVPFPVVEDTSLEVNDTHSKPFASQSEFETDNGCGTRLTTPAKVIVSAVAPVEEIDTFPEIFPDAASSFTRIYIGVAAITPPVCVKVTVLKNPEPAEVLTSQLAGAAIIISSVKFVPETVKVCSSEFKPTHEVKLEMVEELLLKEGWIVTCTVFVSEIDTQASFVIPPYSTT